MKERKKKNLARELNKKHFFFVSRNGLFTCFHLSFHTKMFSSSSSALRGGVSLYYAPPRAYRYLLSPDRPASERADGDPLWNNDRAVCWMRIDDAGTMWFEVFPSLDAGIHYALKGRLASERCYFTIVRPDRPLEWYSDAEIYVSMCHTLGTPWPSLQRDFTTLMYVGLAWIRVSFEAFFGVSSSFGRGAQAWLLRADRADKFSCHMHVPQWCFGNIEDCATAMRLIEDTLYAQAIVGSVRAGGAHPLARMLMFHDSERKKRRHPACVSAPHIQVPVTMECLLDFGVYSNIRQMRMAGQSSSPSKKNALQLFQPPSRVDYNDDTLHMRSVDDPPAAELSGADVIFQTVICTERAKARVPMPNLVDIYEHNDNVSTPQCQRIMTAMERITRAPTATQEEQRELARVLSDAFFVWLGDVWRVYMAHLSTDKPEMTPSGTDSYEQFVRTYLVSLFRGELLHAAREIYHTRSITPVQRANALDRVALATHRAAWYVVLIVRWHLRPRRLRIESVDTAPIRAALDATIATMFRAHLNAPCAISSAMLELDLLSHALFNVAYVGAADGDVGFATLGRLLFDGMAEEYTPQQLFTVITCNLRLELLWHYLNNPVSDETAYRPLTCHRDFDDFWSLAWHPTQVRNDDPCPRHYFPRALLFTALRRGAIWQPHVNVVVANLRRNNMRGSTRFSVIQPSALRIANAAAAAAAAPAATATVTATTTVPASVSILESGIVAAFNGTTLVGPYNASSATNNANNNSSSATLLSHHSNDDTKSVSNTILPLGTRNRLYYSDYCPGALLHFDFAPPAHAPFAPSINLPTIYQP
jgi:hypothetical protein